MSGDLRGTNTKTRLELRSGNIHFEKFRTLTVVFSTSDSDVSRQSFVFFSEAKRNHSKSMVTNGKNNQGCNQGRRSDSRPERRLRAWCRSGNGYRGGGDWQQQLFDWLVSSQAASAFCAKKKKQNCMTRIWKRNPNKHGHGTCAHAAHAACTGLWHSLSIFGICINEVALGDFSFEQRTQQAIDIRTVCQ